MKNLLIILFSLISLTGFSQTIGRLPVAIVQQEYRGDTLKSYFSGDSVKWHTSKDVFSFNKPLFVQGKQLSSLSNSYMSDVDVLFPTGKYFSVATNRAPKTYYQSGLYLDTTMVQNIAKTDNNNYALGTLYASGNFNWQSIMKSHESSVDLDSTGLHFRLGISAPDTTGITDYHFITKRYLLDKLPLKSEIFEYKNNTLRPYSVKSNKVQWYSTTWDAWVQPDLQGINDSIIALNRATLAAPKLFISSGVNWWEWYTQLDGVNLELYSEINTDNVGNYITMSANDGFSMHIRPSQDQYIFHITREVSDQVFNIYGTGKVETSGDIELTKAGTGVILKSPDGTKTKKLILGNDGTLQLVTP